MALLDYPIPIEKSWKTKAEELKDIDKCKEKLEELLSGNCSGFIQERVKIIDGFFDKFKSPADICIILYGGLSQASYKLAKHLEEDNLLFYRPQFSYSRDIEEGGNFLEGTPHPERALLLFDIDMSKGYAMAETADLFQDLGYDRNKIFAYLDQGILHTSFYGPKLAHVDELLEKAERLNGRRKIK